MPPARGPGRRLKVSDRRQKSETSRANWPDGPAQRALLHEIFACGAKYGIRLQSQIRWPFVQAHEIFRKFVQMHIDVAAKVLYFFSCIRKDRTTRPVRQRET